MNKLSRRGPCAGGCDESGVISILTRKQDRALRAKAWRHVRKINAEIARKVYAHREKI